MTLKEALEGGVPELKNSKTRSNYEITVFDNGAKRHYFLKHRKGSFVFYAPYMREHEIERMMGRAVASSRIVSNTVWIYLFEL
jgi:hypothetical protein